MYTFSTDFDYGVLTLFQAKRLFIKDITYYLVPPNGTPASIAPSLERKERGVGTSKPETNGTAHGVTNGTSNGTTGVSYPYATEAQPGNPTVMPKELLDRFHFTFLIRHPRYSIPSYYRCTVPPLDKLTGFYDFMPSEAGYDEVRRVFDYLRSIGQVGPNIATRSMNGTETNGNSVANGHTGVEICVVDADDLLDSPKLVIEAFCTSVGIEYNENMLKWDSEEEQRRAREAFEKWPGFHEDALNSCDLKPRMHVSNAHAKSPYNWQNCWLSAVDCISSTYKVELTCLMGRRKSIRALRRKMLNGLRNSGRRGQRLLGRLSKRISRIMSTLSNSA